MLNIELIITAPRKMIINFSDGISGEVEFCDKFFRGPFHTPLEDFEQFKQAKFNSQEGIIEWPNGFGVAVMEIYDVLQESNICYIS